MHIFKTIKVQALIRKTNEKKESNCCLCLQKQTKTESNDQLIFRLTDISGEDVLIVDLYLYPVHEKAHVLGGGQCCGPFVLVLVLPAILVLGPPRHDRAGLVSARVTDGAVDEVDPVKEVDHVNGHPIVEVLAVGQLHGVLQVQAGVQGRLRLLVQLEALRSRLKLALGPECPVFVEDLFQGHGHGRRWWWRWRRILSFFGELLTVEIEAVKKVV